MCVSLCVHIYEVNKYARYTYVSLSIFHLFASPSLSLSHTHTQFLSLSLPLSLSALLSFTLGRKPLLSPP